MNAVARAARRLLGILAVLAWIAVPIVVAGVVTSRSERAVRTEPPASVWVAAGPVATEVTRTVVARAERRDRPPLLAPAWSGLVEEVHLRAGEPLRSGDAVAVIDGVTRLAAATERPLGRRLVPGDRGRDVAALNGLLGSLGYEAGTGDHFGGSTRRGVLALRRDLGVPIALDDLGAPVDADVFDPAWLVFLAEAEVSVASTALQVGAPAPPAGSAVAELTPQVASVTVTLADQTGAAAAGLDGAPGGSGNSTGTGLPSDAGGTATGDPAPPPTPPEGGGPSSGPQTRTPLATVAEGARLRAAGREIGPIEPDGSLPPETEAAVIRLLGTDSTTTLQLVEPAPAGARTVVANALFSGPGGAMCLASRTGPAARTDVHLVLPAGGSSGQPLVVGAPSGDLDVQVNPPLAVRRRCRA